MLTLSCNWTILRGRDLHYQIKRQVCILLRSEGIQRSFKRHEEALAMIGDVITQVRVSTAVRDDALNPDAVGGDP